MKQKIEINLLYIMLIEAITLLFFFKENFLNLIIAFLLNFILCFIIKKIKINKFIKIILLPITIILFILTLTKITTFITYNLLKYYPSWIIVISLLITSFFLIKKGYHHFIKSLEITFYFYFFLKLITFLLLLPYIKIDSFFFDNQINLQLIPITLSILFINILIKEITSSLPSNQVSIISYFNPLVIKLLSIMIIGNELFNLYEYPFFNLLKRIKYLDFLERMEGILSFSYLFSFIFFLAFLLLIIKTIFLDIAKKHPQT